MDQVTPTLRDPWRLVEPVGSGAMGEVWRGRHAILGQDVAVKIMKPEAARDQQLAARFTNEARIAARLSHRHIARVHDFGAAPDGRPFLVMEYLRGHTLARELESRGRLDRVVAAHIVQQIGSACDAAHTHGIVHRDLKPENVFLVEEDGEACVKVLDFGVAKVTDGLLVTAHGVVTSAHALIGTPMYMSPEQARGQSDLDARSDLWSLAVIAFELLTGRLPFEAATLAQLLYAVLAGPIPPPTRFEPSLGLAVDTWAGRALARDRNARYQTGRELAASLAQALGLPSRVTPSLMPSYPSVSPIVGTPAPVYGGMAVAPTTALPRSVPPPVNPAHGAPGFTNGPHSGPRSAVSRPPPTMQLAAVPSLPPGASPYAMTVARPTQPLVGVGAQSLAGVVVAHPGAAGRGRGARPALAAALVASAIVAVAALIAHRQKRTRPALPRTVIAAPSMSPMPIAPPPSSSAVTVTSPQPAVPTASPTPAPSAPARGPSPPRARPVGARPSGPPANPRVETPRGNPSDSQHTRPSGGGGDNGLPTSM